VTASGRGRSAALTNKAYTDLSASRRRLREVRLTTTPEQRLVLVGKFIEPVTVTPRQKLILDKFVAGLPDSYFDDIEREYSKHPSERAEIAKFFCESLDSALKVASIPLHLCYARVAQRRIDAIFTSERIQSLKKVKPGSQLTIAQEQKAREIANTRFLKERDTEEGKRQVWTLVSRLVQSCANQSTLEQRTPAKMPLDRRHRPCAIVPHLSRRLGAKPRH
jgi:hypothetical protein